MLTTEQSVEEESENLMTEPIPDAKETDLDEAAAKDKPAPSSPGAPKESAPIKPVSAETVKKAPPAQAVQDIPKAKSPSQERETEVRQRKTPSVSRSLFKIVFFSSCEHCLKNVVLNDSLVYVSSPL